MKYVLLIYGNPESRAIWERLSPDERESGLVAYRDLNQALAASGELIATERLGLPGSGHRLPADDDYGFATDGPFAEAKEFVAGFYLLDVATEERAREIAAQVPESPLGLVEVRPTIGLTDVGR